VCVDLDDVVAGGEFGLSGDLPVDHVLQDGVLSIVEDDFEGVFLAFRRLDDVDVAAGALSDLSKHFVFDLLDLNLVIEQHDK